MATMQEMETARKVTTEKFIELSKQANKMMLELENVDIFDPENIYECVKLSEGVQRITFLAIHNIRYTNRDIWDILIQLCKEVAENCVCLTAEQMKERGML